MVLPWFQTRKQEGVSVQGTLCILLGEQTVSTALTYLSPTQTRVSTISLQRQFSDIESFITATDECLSDLGSESEAINQAVFCLSEHWADAHDILPEKVEWVRRMLQELQLQAVGFVSLVDAFNSLLLKDNSKATHLILFTFPQTITLSVVAGGNVLSNLSVGRSDDFVGDVKELAARIRTQLPNVDVSNIAVTLASPDLTDTQLDALQQQIISFDWQTVFGGTSVPPVSFVKQEALYRHVFHQTAEVLRSKQLGAQWQTDPVLEASQAVFGSEVASSLSPAQPAEPEVQSQLDSPTEPAQPTQTSPATLRRKKPTFLTSLFAKKPGFSRKKLAVFGTLGVLLGISTVLVIAWYYLSNHASLILTVVPKRETITKDITVSLEAGSLQITDSYRLPIETVTTEVEVSATKVSTGTKTIGDKATGTVRLVNKTEQSKTLEAGTELTSGNEVVFVLNDEVTIPAATVETTATGETKEYGTLETSATAKEIGEEGNIGSGQDLRVADFAESTYLAQTVGDFSGGSSQEVAIVAQKDVDSLVGDLKQQAIEEARTKLDESKQEGMRIAPPHNIAVTSQQVSTEVGEEAEEVTVSLVAQAEAFAYSSRDTRDLAIAVLTDAIPEGTTLASSEPQVLTTFTEDDETDETQLELNVSAEVISQVDPNDVIHRLTGRQIVAITQQAVDVPGVERISVQWVPPPAGWFSDSVPDNDDRIQVYVQE